MVGMADGLARSGFDLDLAFGESRESAFQKAISRAHVECKSDQACRRTGNVAIEVRQGSTERGKGRPSGISVTTAAWWSIEYADDCWLTIRTSILKILVRHALDVCGTEMVGDGRRFECVLLPLHWLTAPSKHT